MDTSGTSLRELSSMNNYDPMPPNNTMHQGQMMQPMYHGQMPPQQMPPNNIPVYNPQYQQPQQGYPEYHGNPNEQYDYGDNYNENFAETGDINDLVDKNHSGLKEPEDEEQVKKIPDNTKKTKIPEAIREPLAILILYILLSNEHVKLFIGKYVHHINPDDTGKVPLTGIIAYGIILAVLFSVTKKLFFHKLEAE